MSVNNEMENATVGRLPDVSSADSDTSQDVEKTKHKRKSSKSSKKSKVKNKADNTNVNTNADDVADIDTDKAGNDGKDANSGSLRKSVNTAGTVANIVAAANQALAMANLLMWLKLMMQAAVMIAQSLFSAFITAIITFAQTVATAIVSGVTAIATALGTTVATVAVSLATLFVAGVVTVVGVFIGNSMTNEIAKYDSASDCSVYVDLVKSDTADDIDINAVQLEYAQKVYSFYTTYGAPDEHIAGILGNWSIESGIDPTSVETIYDEKYSVTGPRKSAALEDLDDFTLNTVFPAYGSDWETNGVNENAYLASDGKYYCGLGLGQWTGENTLNFLNAANSVEMYWYSLDFQLIYTIMPGGYRVEWLCNWFTEPEDNAETAAVSFAKYWEGNTTRGIPNRKEAAAQWMVQFADWTVDTDYANSLIELAGAARIDASDSGVSSALDDCQTQRMRYNNSSIASAAVSYAWPERDAGRENNGTILYQTVHDYIFPGDRYYASCCRGGSVAVRWSGSDDTFTIGGCAQQYSYCMSSTKWEAVHWDGDTSKLQPGDVLICNNCHTLVYTGNELIKQIHGEDMADNLVAVEASFGYKSPECIPLWAGYYDGSADGNGHVHNFVAFRCVHPDNSDTYANAADGVNEHEDVPYDPSLYVR